MDTKKEIVELTKEAIIIQSIAGNRDGLEEILNLFADQFSDRSIFDVKRFGQGGIVCAIIKPRNKEPKIWFNAHLDVVPGQDRLFIPVVKNDKLFGRGALDMKTAAACLTHLSKQLIISGKNVGLMLVTDEEIGGHNGTKFLIDNKFIQPEFVIVGEPTDLEIGVESKGIISLEIVATGKSAHGSRPWLGKNALSEMINPIQKLLLAFPIPKKEIWITTVSIGTIQAGSAVNQVPDVCTLKLDIRYIPTDDPQKIIKYIKSIFRKQKVFVRMLESPIFSDKKNSFIKIFSKSVEQVLHKKSKFRRGHGSADIRFFTEKGIPSIAFGLRGGGLHANNEWVSLTEIEEYLQILQTFIISLN